MTRGTPPDSGRRHRRASPREADAIGAAAGDVQPVRDVAGDAVADRAAAGRSAPRRADRPGASRAASACRAARAGRRARPAAGRRRRRQDAHLLEQRQRQVLRFVDDRRPRTPAAARACRGTRRAGNSARCATRRAAGRCVRSSTETTPKSIEHDLQQIFARRERIGHERAERLADRGSAARRGTASSCRCRCRRSAR